MLLAKNISLKQHNTFGIDINAAYFAAFQNADELAEIVSLDDMRHLPKFILGGGSNVLFTKNYAGLVLQNAIKGIKVEREDDDHVYIRVGAGENWHRFVMHCVSHHLGGIENLSLIPGTVGAAPIQNIGAYGVELSSVFVELSAMKLADASLQIFTRQACEFGYRDSIFKRLHKNQFVILSVLFRLQKKPILHLDYGAVKETLKLLNRNYFTIKDVSDAVIHIRRSKLPDPSEIGNAGSFFKNPVISQATFSELQKQFPDIPHFMLDDHIKINAGWLIEQCGFKGKQVGNVGVYHKQALILINLGKATGSEVVNLALQIQDAVQAQFGISLETEVNLI